MSQFENENAAPAAQTRREREEALIRQSRIFAESKSIMQELAAALEAAHRREDEIRRIVRFEVIEPREKILAILDGAEASA